MKKTFILEDLDCAVCAGKIEKAVSEMDGVNSCSVALLTQKLVMDVEDDKAAEVKDAMIRLVKKLEPDVTVKEK